MTRSSLEKEAKPPTKFGYLLSIPSTARPPAPDVRYLIPAWNWVTATSATSPSSSRVGNVLRVYLGRPWFESGIGELLGVVVASPPPGTVLPSGLQPFVSGFGSDPVFVDRTGRNPEGDRLPARVHVGTSLLLEEQQGDSAGSTSPATRSTGTRTGACGSRTSPSVPASRTSPSSSWRSFATSPPPSPASSSLGSCRPTSSSSPPTGRWA